MEKGRRIKAYWETLKSWSKRIRLRWILQFLLELAILCGVVAFCFYKSYFAMLLMIPCFPFYFKYRRNIERKRRQEKLRYEFKEFMTVTAAALSAGYSMENALRSAEKDIVSLLNEKAEMVRALKVINRRIALNEPAEKVLLEFGRSVGLEDIESFGEIFSFAKRSGGDYAGIMRKTANVLQEKIETTRDIDTIISQKKMEARIMDFVPIGIILYLQFSSPDFLSGLYGSVVGVIVMSVCLAIYVFAILFSEKLVDLRV